MFDFVAAMTDESDTALYRRVTYEMMQRYWPTFFIASITFHANISAQTGWPWRPRLLQMKCLSWRQTVHRP